MNQISDSIMERLATLGISQKEFSELLIRLLDYGVLNRDESLIEATLYDRYLQCSDLIEDYLAMIHVTIFHDRTFRFVRLFPPSAEVPGVADNDHETLSPFNGGLRTKPSPQAIAVILVLRVEYEKALREGKVDQNGGALIPLEALSISLQNLLKQGLPNTQAERNAIFKQLRQLRLIKFNSESELSLENGQDSWLKIEPSITSYVTQSMLDQLYPPEHSPANQDNRRESIDHTKH
ncbi:hypothetical protein NBRC116583_35130 [Arenicella sp. 4NH20-0111]|uniref:DUF4194 domain-containing protein n=1 Tax=Arenicella sp. 4NH20-0111 TaxID=3127648 RepID=UPI00310432D1